MRQDARFFAKVGMVALSLAIGSATALAASGGGGGGSGGGSSGTPPCKQAKGQCKSGSLEDKYRYEQGRALALAGRYDEALTALNAIESPDSMTFTMIGYATRKLGKYDEGLAFYQKALALDPK